MPKRAVAYGIADSYNTPPTLMRGHKPPTSAARQELEAQVATFNRRQGAKRYSIATVFEDGTFEAAYSPSEVGDWTMGIVKWFSATRGYGFVVIAADDGERDVFLHAAVAEKCGVKDLQPGDPVSIRYGKTSKGYVAVEVEQAQ